PGRLTEDRSKCAPDGQRQQNVTITSPPCVPRWQGDNGGATYQGVTAEEVTVIRYRPRSNAQVDTILRSQGLASSPEEEKHAQDAFARFFEKRYEFYNRKIKWVAIQGICEISPPDMPCFRDEARRLNAEHRPFAMFYTTATVQWELFDQWTQLGVVNIGGWHFTSEFNTQRRPFHWDVFMDGTRTARNVAEYWCKKMAGKNATLAGDPLMHNRRRKLGIITQRFPPTQKNAEDLRAMVTGGMCGGPNDAAGIQTTPSDIYSAQQTAVTAMERLQEEGATTIVMLSDPIGPRFFTTAATSQRYYPEHLLAGSGLIDYDVLGRLYDTSQWVNAFGPGHLAEPIPFRESDAAKAAADVGVSNVYSGANLLYAYMSLVASMVQMAGPNLNPATVERGVLNLPPSGGWERTRNPASVLVKFGPGDYTAIEDSRHTRWDPSATSKIDGGRGAYISFEGGRRFEVGRWPGGEPRQ
ncbi:MAG TPA: hypothetical protein VM840_00685, partial [Actinomycetota bacterium]|nr:hypothetical protein [Actinomycetota bacterium]